MLKHTSLPEIINDVGISLEIFGFILLLLVGGRNPTEELIASERHEASKFDVFRGKIVPDKFVYKCLIFSIGLVVVGLFLQLSPFNP